MLTFRHALLAAAALASLAGTQARAAPSISPMLPTPSVPASLLTSPLAAFLAPQLLGAAPSTQLVEFDVVLPLSNTAGLDTLLAQLSDPTSPQYHKWLTPTVFNAKFGPSAAMLNLVAMQLRLYGFGVTVQSRSLHVAGTAAQVNAIFNANLQLATDPAGHARVVAGNALSLPDALAGSGIMVPAFHMGISDANPLVMRSAAGYVMRRTGGYASQASKTSAYMFGDLKQAYGYPSYQPASGSTNTDGTGATVAVIMSSDVQDSDVAMLFNGDNFMANSGQSANPAIFARRPVDGGPTAASSSSGAEEATLDVEQVLGGAPGAHVVLYDTPDLSDQSQISALVAIVNDNTADVVSMSYGQCELYYTAAYNNGVDQTALLTLYSQLYKQGNAQGITFIGASGDAGALGCMSPSYFAGNGGTFVPGVSVPAADPDVTAVGGSNLMTAGALGGTDSSYLRENAFADMEPALDPFGTGTAITGGVFGAGGGTSTLYAKPAYQGLVNTGSTTMRTIPDIGMEVGGCPDFGTGTCDTVGTLPGDTGERSSIAVIFNGAPDFVIGTSAAAPEMASVAALLVQAQGRQGNLNPDLYTLAQRQAAGGTAYFHQNIPGNGGLQALTGPYNTSVGNGSPNVAALLGFVGGAMAGAPGTASNP